MIKKENKFFNLEKLIYDTAFKEEEKCSDGIEIEDEYEMEEPRS